MSFKIKKIIAFILNFLGILNLLIWYQKKKYQGNYIRLINYHNTDKMSPRTFHKQLKWFTEYFQNVDYQEFERFLSSETKGIGKPGIMLTFDDGLEGNYLYGRDLLNKEGFTGYFMVSSDLIGKEDYMNKEQIKELLSEGHVIGCHTATHHRMNENDSNEVLEHEITESKNILEREFNRPVEIFCWCGGEEEHYTRRAEEFIEKSGYKYGFMTNSAPLLQTENHYHIQRINIEASWPIYLMKFQISGIMDFKFRNKRNRVNALTTL